MIPFEFDISRINYIYIFQKMQNNQYFSCNLTLSVFLVPLASSILSVLKNHKHIQDETNGMIHTSSPITHVLKKKCKQRLSRVMCKLAERGALFLESSQQSTRQQLGSLVFSTILLATQTNP